MDTGNKLSSRQLMAINHLITSSSLEEASQNAKVSRPTLYKWLNDEVFMFVLKRRRYKVIRDALDRLSDSTTKAVEELVKVLGSQREDIRRLVCNDIIAHTFKKLELEDIEQRLDKVERMVLERKTYR